MNRARAATSFYITFNYRWDKLEPVHLAFQEDSEMTYTVVLLREQDGRFSVSVPALRGCHTWGNDIPEALQMVQEALELHIGSLQAHGDPIPDDVTSFTVDVADATEAVVYKVSVPSPEAVAIA